MIKKTINFKIVWKSYSADIAVCLKRHMLIETSLYFVQFDIGRRVSYFAKKFQTKNLLEHYCKSEFHVTCPNTLQLSLISKEKGAKKKICLSKGLSQQWVSLARKSGWETAKLAPPYRWTSRPSRIAVRVIFINNMVREVVGVMVVGVMVISNELLGNQLPLVYQEAKVWVLSSYFQICIKQLLLSNGWVVNVWCKGKARLEKKQ